MNLNLAAMNTFLPSSRALSLACLLACTNSTPAHVFEPVNSPKTVPSVAANEPEAAYVPLPVLHRKGKHAADTLPFIRETPPPPPHITQPVMPSMQEILEKATAPERKNPPGHLGLDSLLQHYVSSEGRVNYKGLQSAKAALDAYCQLLSHNPVQEDWPKADKMAYWINAYNAFTLQLIVAHYPAKSIMNFDGGKTWDVKRIRIGDKKYSLNNIENDILRPQFKDPRIHFAINCAARSCPPLWNHAFTAENLNGALDARAKAFINNAKFNTLTSTTATISQIFNWYGADFGNLPSFLNRYSNTKINAGARIGFSEYNWDLNE